MDKGNWMCSVCNYVAKRRIHTSDHIESKHLPHNPFICNICGKSSRSMRGYRKHMTTHHDIKYLMHDTE